MHARFTNCVSNISYLSLYKFLKFQFIDYHQLLQFKKKIKKIKNPWLENVPRI